ncbi:MetQ/NlpA family ABC transporter substrate-binding protein [Haloplasma contractile]|uniref:NLPA family lipoprotein n=1 Tax=Haloplasma contractile SSD-17B TaxID=1033810 RepID=F7Q0E4_9MOLU|nr:MetQ/NlpA family ABC transporter substrate-binding protein [Haloplasma contractile]ERJ12710.1 Putative NLPA family lipoprotein [Haloplasma contractile SSD-17B]
MKKILSVLTIFVLSIVLIGCKQQEDANVINVGVAFYPMKDILLLIEDDLEKDGFDLKISEFTDYQTPNNLLKNQELDANMIQHKYFLETFNDANNADLVIIQPIYHATLALYSKDYESLEQIPEGSNITLSDDQTNISRALYLLGQAGLLTFKNDKTVNLTFDDIDSNPKKLTFNERVPATSLAQKYKETGLAVMYPTYARSLELVGDEQRLYVEKQDSVTEGYAISLVARNDHKDSDKIEALKKYLKSDEVRQFLIDEYGWASRPAF